MSDESSPPSSENQTNLEAAINAALNVDKVVLLNKEDIVSSHSQESSNCLEAETLNTNQNNSNSVGSQISENPNTDHNIKNINSGSTESKGKSEDSDQTSVKKVETINPRLHLDTGNMAEEKTTTPPNTPEINSNGPDGLPKINEEKEDDEFAMRQSPKILNFFCNVYHGIKNIVHMFWDLTKTCGQNTKQYIPFGFGCGVFVLLTYLLEYIMIPLGYNDLPHFPARLQYIARICALGLFPVMVSWFLGQSPMLIRLVQASMRDMFLVVLSFCALATFHPVEQMHWMFIYIVITTELRLVQWLSTCYGWKCLQKAVDGPMQISLVTLVLYTFLSVVGQELGYMDRPNIVKPMAQSVDVGTDTPQWAYPNMCNIVERLFCGAAKPATLEEAM